jgi:hypothetical protein
MKKFNINVFTEEGDVKGKVTVKKGKICRAKVEKEKVLKVLGAEAENENDNIR